MILLNSRAVESIPNAVSFDSAHLWGSEEIYFTSALDENCSDQKGLFEETEHWCVCVYSEVSNRVTDYKERARRRPSARRWMAGPQGTRGKSL